MKEKNKAFINNLDSNGKFRIEMDMKEMKKNYPNLSQEHLKSLETRALKNINREKQEEQKNETGNDGANLTKEEMKTIKELIEKENEIWKDPEMTEEKAKEIMKKWEKDKSNNSVGYKLPPHLQQYRIDSNEFNNLRIIKKDFEYRISKIQETKDGLKPTISLFKNGERLNIDNTLLISAKSRATFANNCRVDEKTSKEILKDLMNIEEILKSISTTDDKKDDKVKPEVLTKEKIEAASKILQDPKLLYTIRSIFPKLLIAGEVKNCLLIYLSGTSRILESPISLTGKGDSSVGKSYIVEKNLKLFPKDAYIDVSDATARSFFHAKKDAFKHKIMVFFEKPGTDQTDYSIRSLQSEKKLKLQITVKDPVTGEFRMEVKEVDGPVAFITTTTSPTIHAENETRCFSWYSDESEKQTLDTFEMTDAKYRGVEEISENELKKITNIQKILKPYPVSIPYIEEIRDKFPRKPVRVRRDYGRLLSLIEVTTLLHQLQREKKIINGKEYLESTLADFYIAKVIGEVVLRETIFELSPKSKEIVKVARKFLKEKEGESGEESTFTIRELSQRLKEDYDTVHKWFKPAFERGYFKIKEDHKGAKAAKYILTEQKSENRVILPTLEQIAEKYPNCVDQVYDPITGEKVEIKTNTTDVPMENEKV